MTFEPISGHPGTLWIRFSAADRTGPEFRSAMQALANRLPDPAMIPHAMGDGYLVQDDPRTRRVLERIRKRYFDVEPQTQLPLGVG